MNKTRVMKILKLIIFIDVIIAILYFSFYGFPKKPMELLSKIGILSLISTLLFISFDKFLWKIGFKGFTLGGIPNIEGEWNTEIINNQDEQIQKAIMRIKQTYLNISIEVDVERGNSITLIGDLLSVNEKWQLIWNWNAAYKGSEFYGTDIVDLKQNNTVMEGLYFTNANYAGYRCTAGTLKAIKIQQNLGER